MAANRAQETGNSGGGGGFWEFANNLIGAAASVFGSYAGRDKEGSQARLEGYSQGLGIDAGMIRIAVLALVALIIFKIVR